MPVERVSGSPCLVYVFPMLPLSLARSFLISAFLVAPSKHPYQLCALAPFAMALWVAISRTVDYWHHYADIVAGMVRTNS
jgi:hypothetical protein